LAQASIGGVIRESFVLTDPHTHTYTHTRIRWRVSQKVTFKMCDSYDRLHLFKFLQTVTRRTGKVG